MIDLISYSGAALAALQSYNGAITALATVCIALFTIVLARVSKGQSRLTRTLQRAFVVVKEIDVLIDQSPGGEPYQYRLSAVLEISGQTPAVRMAHTLSCGYIAPERIKTFDFPDQGAASRGVLGPRATYQTASQRLSPANIEQIKNGTDRWFVWGWVDYDDIFVGTPRHRTEFCFEVSVRPMASGQYLFGFPMHDKFNATDDDCLRKPAPYTPA